MDSFLLLGILLLLPAFLLRTVPENRRYAVFLLGQFQGLKGPGVVMKAPFAERKWVSLSIGARGELIGSELARIEGYDYPVALAEQVTPGSPIRITGFSGTQILVSRDLSPQGEIACPKCGHKFTPDLRV